MTPMSGNEWPSGLLRCRRTASKKQMSVILRFGVCVGQKAALSCSAGGAQLGTTSCFAAQASAGLDHTTMRATDYIV